MKTEIRDLLFYAAYDFYRTKNNDPLVQYREGKLDGVLTVARTVLNYDVIEEILEEAKIATAK